MLDDEKEQKFIDLEELVRDLEERLTDLDNPEPEFLEIDGASRQVIVHWLKDTDVATIVSLGDAKTEFLSNARAIDTTEGKPKVSHGDIMVIGGDCPWYAFCAQVDIRDDGAGFQAEDDITPPVAESDENADEDVEREFIVWGGCGSGGGDDCPPGNSVSVVGAVSTSGATPGNFTKVLSKQASNLPVLNYTIDKLKTLSLTKDVTGPSDDDAEDFLAFGESFTQCSSECTGLFVNLKKFSSTSEKYDLAATVSLNNLKLTPNELVPTPLKISSTTLSVTSSTISSDPCGSLSSVAGSSSESILTQISKDTAETPETIYNPSVHFLGESKVSIGVNIPTGVQGSAISNVSNVFLPVIPSDACPETTTFNFMSGATLSISEDDSDCDDGSGEQCKTITVSMTPIVGSLTFNCGVLTSSTAPTSGGQTALEETFKVACGCDPEGPCDSATGINLVNVTFTSHPDNTTHTDINESYVLSKVGDCQYENMEGDNNMAILYGSVDGLWQASGSSEDGYAFYASPGDTEKGNTPNTIPDQNITSGVATARLIVSFS